MRAINKIIIHCTATKEGLPVTVATVTAWHKQRGFITIGYHYLIGLNGEIWKGRNEREIGAHVSGNNSASIGICYVGGLDVNGRPKDTRTPAQKESLIKLLRELKEKYPNSTVLGHRDYSPDLNGNGIIEEWEWLKACPCFDAKNEYKNLK